MGIRPGEDTPFMLPTNSTIYAYLFIKEEANVLIDDIPINYIIIIVVVIVVFLRRRKK